MRKRDLQKMLKELMGEHLIIAVIKNQYYFGLLNGTKIESKDLYLATGIKSQPYYILPIKEISSINIMGMLKIKDFIKNIFIFFVDTPIISLWELWCKRDGREIPTLIKNYKKN